MLLIVNEGAHNSTLLVLAPHNHTQAELKEWADLWEDILAEDIGNRHGISIVINCIVLLSFGFVSKVGTIYGQLAASW